MRDLQKVLLVTDMDGTFLPDNKIPTQGNLTAVRRFIAAGAKFSIATGRALQAAQQYFQQIPVNAPAILCNGGMIYDIHAKKSLHDVFLTPVAAEIMQDLLVQFPDAGCEILTEREVYVPQFNDLEHEHNQICQIIPAEISIAQAFDLPADWYKVLFANTPERILAMAEYVKTKSYGKAAEFVISAPVYFEMLPHGISKGTALEKLRTAGGFEDFTICAVGDFYNDLEMLEYADLAFCPANGADEAKAVSDIVLTKTNNADAVAEAMEYLMNS